MHRSIAMLTSFCMFALAGVAHDAEPRQDLVAPARPSAAEAARADIKASCGFVPAFMNQLPDLALAAPGTR